MTKNNSNVAIIVGLLVVAIIIVVFVGFKSSPEMIIGNEENREVMIDENNNEVVVNDATNDNFLLRDEWSETERAEKNIQALGEGQIIESGIIQDPTDANIYYFSSYAVDKETRSVLASVYRYNMTDYSFERIYKKTTSYDYNGYDGEEHWFLNGEPYAYKYGIVSYDSGKLQLIGYAHLIDNSDGAQFSDEPSIGNVGLIFDINDPYGTATDNTADIF